MTIRSGIWLVFVVLAAAACGATAERRVGTDRTAIKGGDPNSSDAGQLGDANNLSCDDLAQSARTEVLAAISANAACTVDADCVGTFFGANCFDSCESAVNASGTAAVDAARATVNAAQCATFEAHGCTLIPPPCVPPTPPRCIANVCQ
jgi:hypothetical protein